MSDEVEVRELKNSRCLYRIKDVLSLSDEAADEVSQIVTKKDLEEREESGEEKKRRRKNR